ncbi:MAG: GIY-YIG nuclease family protein [Bacteroidota bacterium]
MPRSFWVYVMASQSRVLYTGMTNDIARRLGKHRSGIGSAFVRRYRVTRLVHLEEYPTPGEAIRREKEIKAWRREKRVWLIEGSNPEWRDLAEES